jgi:hypothetical protein
VARNQAWGRYQPPYQGYEFLGLSAFDLDNCLQDPSFMRERLAMAVSVACVAALRVLRGFT